MDVRVCAPSYKRPKVLTLEKYPSTKIYVDEGEYEDYVKANPEGSRIVSVPSGVQGNVCRIRNYILDTEFKDGAAAVCIIDDDMRKIERFVPVERQFGIFGYSRKELTEGELYAFLEHGCSLCDEWGFKLWGINCVSDPKAYLQYTPFNTVKYIGSPFQVHLKNPIRYDEGLPLKEDYDITLQHLRKYRGALRFNAYHYDCLQSEQTGGCATYRNTRKEAQQFAALQKKWGTRLIRKDGGSRKQFDYNPVMKSPIRGV